jgi:site-specific recombinase XerD
MFRTLLTAAAVSALLAGTAHAQDVKTAEGLRDKALLDAPPGTSPRT